jgi:hypothetical protein
MFGQDFHGEVPEPVEKIEIQQEEPQEVAQEVPEKPDVPDEVPISSFQELIESNEWDPEWVNTLRVPVKVDGNTTETTFSELVKSYQISSAAEKRLEESKQKAKTLYQQIAEKSDALQAEYAVAANLITKVEQVLNQDTAQIDWKTLREDDPAEYSARKSEIAERRQQIDSMKQEALHAYQQSLAKQSHEAEAQRNQTLMAEHAMLLEKMPEWQNAEKAKTEKTEIAHYLMGLGFSEQEVYNATDHKSILLARKAMLYDKGQKSIDTAKKRVVTVPKVLKPGAPKPQEKQSQERVTQLRSRLRTSGSLNDAFALLKATRS